MSETVKLIIEIPEKTVNEIKDNAMFAKDIANDIKWDVTGAVVNGTPLDSVKAEIDTDLSGDMFDEYGNETRLHKELMEILDNIGKGE